MVCIFNISMRLQSGSKILVELSSYILIRVDCLIAGIVVRFRTVRLTGYEGNRAQSGQKKEYLFHGYMLFLYLQY